MKTILLILGLAGAVCWADTYYVETNTWQWSQSQFAGWNLQTNCPTPPVRLVANPAFTATTNDAAMLLSVGVDPTQPYPAIKASLKALDPQRTNTVIHGITIELLGDVVAGVLKIDPQTGTIIVPPTTIPQP